MAQAVVLGLTLRSGSNGGPAFVLTVPAGGTGLLAVKYAALVVVSVAVCPLVTLVSFVMGLLLFHAGPVTLLSGRRRPGRRWRSS